MSSALLTLVAFLTLCSGVTLVAFIAFGSGLTGVALVALRAVERIVGERHRLQFGQSHIGVRCAAVGVHLNAHPHVAAGPVNIVERLAAVGFALANGHRQNAVAVGERCLRLAVHHGLAALVGQRYAHADFRVAH